MRPALPESLPATGIAPVTDHYVVVAQAGARPEPLLDSVRRLVERRDLLVMLIRRDIVIKYKQSVMGFFWAILMPLLVVVGGILVRVVFSTMAGRAVGADDMATIAVKSVPWAFVVAAIRFSTNSLVANAALVTKIYLPRQVFPVAATCSQLVDLLIASLPLAVLLGFLQVGLSIHLLWVPVLLAILVLNVLAAALILSAASLFFRDVKYLVEVALTFAIFVTPVFYSVQDLPKWKTVLLLNPAAPILEGLSAAVVAHQNPELPWVLYSLGVGAIGLLVAMLFFRRVEPLFAERI